MKHAILFLILLLGVATGYSQTAPKGMNYQAVARDLKGNVLSNEKISLKIDLTSLQADHEKNYYSETHEVTTNQLGLFTLIIGEGKSVKNNYIDVPWSTEDIFINVAILDKSSKLFNTISSSKLLAVPYAYYAVTASQLADSKDADDLESRASKDLYWTLVGNATENKNKAQFGTTNCADIMVVSNNIERMRVFCDGNINMNNNLSVNKNVRIDSSLTVLHKGYIGHDFVANGNVTLNALLNNRYTNTTINGNLTVANESSTYFTGSLTVDKATWLKSTLRVDGISDLNAALNVNLGAPTYLSGTLLVDRASWLKSTLRVDGITDLNAALNVNNMAPSYLSGALTVDKNTWLKGKLRVDLSTTLNDSLTVTNTKPTLLTGLLQVNQKSTFKDQVLLDNPSFQSSSITTGALVVNGGVGIGKNIWIGGEFHTLGPVKLESSLDVQGPANFYGTVTAHKYTDIKAGLKVSGSTKLDSVLTVDGATDLNSSLNVDGTTTTKAVNASGQVTINVNVGGGDGSFGAYPLRVQGSQQGIAVQLTEGTPDGDNNFVTFFNSGGGAVGAIEGQTSGEVASDPQFIFDESILIAEEIKCGVAIGLAAIPVVVAGLGASAGPCGACIAMAAADLVLATANLVAFNVFAFENLGVTYSSGSADYAEWLERLNPAEKITAGEIVGVTGGKISKYTKDAKQFMVISTKPAVLGNVPVPGTESLHEKVAFMGQIPVKVRGVVMSGDYILPSGNNDGAGIAVSPEKIAPEQYKEIVGVAWSGSLMVNGVSMVNMAIGLNSNDVARLAEKHEKRIEALETKFSSINERLLALESGKPEMKGISSTEAPVVAATPERVLSREELAFANMPAELDDNVMAEAMDYLRNQYAKNNVNISKNAGLNKLFNDMSFQKQVITRAQENYKVTYQQVMKNNKN